MPVSLIAPDADNYQVGKGIVSFKPDGAADYIDLGNVAELEYTPEHRKARPLFEPRRHPHQGQIRRADPQRHAAHPHGGIDRAKPVDAADGHGR